MTYMLEKILPEDQEKIIKDVNIASIRKELIYIKKINDFTNTWAIDRKKNYYMFLATDLVVTDMLCCKYYMFFEEKWHTLHINGVFGNEINIGEKDKLDLDFLTRLQEEITKAFSVYGRTGTGSFDKSGALTLEVIPGFDWEMQA